MTAFDCPMGCGGRIFDTDHGLWHADECSAWKNATSAERSEKMAPLFAEHNRLMEAKRAEYRVEREAWEKAKRAKEASR